MHTQRSRRSLGTTLTEVVISSALFTGLMVFGIPVMTQMGQAGDEGAARLAVSSTNQSALLKMAAELQNGSTTATDFAGIPRFAINPGVAPTPVVDQRNGFMGGFRGRLAGQTGEQVSSYVSSGAISEGLGGVAGTQAAEGPVNIEGYVNGELAAVGSGFHGGTALGRARSAGLTDRERFGEPSMRPRFAQIPTNDVLTFQKVIDYVMVSGEPDIVWSSSITYRIEGNRLIRVQDGRKSVISNNAVGLKLDVTDLGTVAITIVSQKQAGATGRVQYQANQIEVSPKN